MHHRHKIAQHLLLAEEAEQNDKNRFARSRRLADGLGKKEKSYNEMMERHETSNRGKTDAVLIDGVKHVASRFHSLGRDHSKQGHGLQVSETIEADMGNHIVGNVALPR